VRGGARRINWVLFFDGQEGKAQFARKRNSCTLFCMAAMSATLPQQDSAVRSDSVSRYILYALLFGVGFLLRFAFVLWHKTYVFPAGGIYEDVSIAMRLATGQGFSSPFGLDTGPTAWIAPGYPFLISTVFKAFGVYSTTSMVVILGLQCAMAGATGITIYALGKRTVGERLGLWAAWIWTVSPIFFRWPTTWIWDFAASALLLALILIVTQDVAEKGSLKRWLGLGGLWGVAALTNPALISVLPFTTAYAAFMSRRTGRKWLGGLAVSAVLFAAMIAPWLIRNDIVFGHPVFLRSNYWFEFHLGNYHYSNGMGFSGKHPTKNPIQMNKYVMLGEQGYIAWAKNDAFQFVREYPGEFWDLTRHRVWWFWDGTPLGYSSGEWWKPWKYWPLSCAGWLGLLFVLTRRPRGWVLFAAALFIYPVPYYLSYCVSKYRHAIEPELLLLSVYLAYVMWGEIRAIVQHAIAWRSASVARHEVEVQA
jgi:4-amino-4-deoxy-L-arabinose transferase-like glycosyltransferase